jgi:hypothetical protein
MNNYSYKLTGCILALALVWSASSASADSAQSLLPTPNLSQPEPFAGKVVFHQKTGPTLTTDHVLDTLDRIEHLASGSR